MVDNDALQEKECARTRGNIRCMMGEGVRIIFAVAG
jgi:hypothetical protein